MRLLLIKFIIKITSIIINCRSTAGYFGLLLLFSISIVHAFPDPMAWSMDSDMPEQQDQMLPDEKGDGKFTSSEQAAQNFAAIKEYMAELQWQNTYDGRLSRACPTGEGVYRVRSEYSRGHGDRRWDFQCRKVVQEGTPTCTQSSYINQFQEYISFMCGKNQYIGGVESYHENSKEDRRWKYTCCSAASQVTRDCRLTGYVNNPNANMEYQANDGEVITGVFSYYVSGKK